MLNRITTIISVTLLSSAAMADPVDNPYLDGLGNTNVPQYPIPPQKELSQIKNDPLMQYLQGLKRDEESDEKIQEEKESALRKQALRNTALAIGAQAGLYRESQHMQKMLDNYSGELGEVFNFGQLMILDDQGRIIKPPVITEIKGQAKIGPGSQTLRIAEQSYRIYKRPAFSLSSPHWRDYLDFRFPKPQEPNTALLPRTEEEIAEWKTNILDGWKSGITQAYQIGEVRVAKLVRDHTGMTRYHLLRLYGMVTEPVVDETYNAVTGGGDAMNVRDTVLTIKQTSLLNNASDQWKPLPRLKDIDYLHLLPN